MASSVLTKTADAPPNAQKSSNHEFLKPLEQLQDVRALNLLINILSKIIQEPNDKQKQDLNYETIHKKIGDCKPAFDILSSIGFKQYTSTDDKNEKRLKIDINANNIAYLKYIYNEIMYKYSGRSRVQRVQLNCKDLMKIHPPRYSNAGKQLVFKTICPHTYHDCMGTMIYSQHQLIALPATLADPTDFLKHKITIESNIFNYVSNTEDESTLHFYVNFADKNLFGYYQGPLFAQDEIMTTEHPILASLREKLFDSNSLSTTCDGAVVVLNVLKHGHFNQKGLSQIYGNRFRRATKQMLLDSLEVCSPPIIDNIICIPSLYNSRVKYKQQEIDMILRTAYCGFNGAKSETMYQILKGWRNPNAAASIDLCTHEQLLWILNRETLTEGKLLENKDTFLGYFKDNNMDGGKLENISRKQFGIEVVKYANGDKKLNGPAMKVYRALKNYGDLIEEGIFDEYVQNDSGDDDEKKDESESKGQVEMKKIVLHTGNWGCGAFGGNIELHFILQVVAAVAAGVDEMYYHAVDDKCMVQAVSGMDVLLNEILPNSKDQKGKFKRDLFVDEILKRGYRWGTPNGT